MGLQVRTYESNVTLLETRERYKVTIEEYRLWGEYLFIKFKIPMPKANIDNSFLVAYLDKLEKRKVIYCRVKDKTAEEVTVIQTRKGGASE